METQCWRWVCGLRFVCQGDDYASPMSGILNRRQEFFHYLHPYGLYAVYAHRYN